MPPGRHCTTAPRRWRSDAETFYARPPSLSVAQFFGVTIQVPGHVSCGASLSDDGTLRLPDVAAAGRAVLAARPEALQIRDGPGPDTVAGTVVAARFAGTHQTIKVQISRQQVLTVHAPVGTHVELGALVRSSATP